MRHALPMPSRHEREREHEYEHGRSALPALAPSASLRLHGARCRRLHLRHRPLHHLLHALAALVHVEPARALIEHARLLALRRHGRRREHLAGLEAAERLEPPAPTRAPPAPLALIPP